METRHYNILFCIEKDVVNSSAPSTWFIWEKTSNSSCGLTDTSERLSNTLIWNPTVFTRWYSGVLEVWNRWIYFCIALLSFSFKDSLDRKENIVYSHGHISYFFFSFFCLSIKFVSTVVPEFYSEFAGLVMALSPQCFHGENTNFSVH